MTESAEERAKRGIFWDDGPAENHQLKSIRELRMLEEAKAKQEEQKSEREKARQGVLIPPLTAPESIVLELAMKKRLSSLQMEFLYDPYLPAKCVVGFYGRGSTAKSSFVATLAATKSDEWSTLWISAEELKDWITQRHLAAGGDEATLAVFAHKAIEKDAQGRVIGSTFNVYQDLETSIQLAAKQLEGVYNPSRPLRLVVLDTGVGLTTWGKGESANDDGSVKRLLGYLQYLAEKHDLCIALIGHSNKGKHDYFADTVAGSSAWTNSPRLSFVHARDRREDYAFVMRVAKSNLSSGFAVTYSTEPVLKLHQHEDGHASVMCRVNMEPIVWGESAAAELFEDATRKPDEDEGMTRMPTLVEQAILKLVELVGTTPADGYVTREDVERELRRSIDRPRWKKVDDQLHLNPTVVIEAGPQNKRHYRKRT